MKKLTCVFLAMLVATALFGCDFFGNKEYKISYDLKVEPVNLDPQTATDTASLTVINNIFEGLFILDNDGKVQPGMAESYTVSPDGKVYTFTLKNDLAWENGEPLTAFDFEFGLRRVLTPSTKSIYAKKYYSIEKAHEVNVGTQPPTSLGVKALSPTTLEIRLTARNDNLPMLLSQTPAMPCNEKYFKDTRGRYGLEPSTLISNGVYKLGSWKHREYIRLDRNEHYYQNLDKAPSAVSLWINTNKVVNDEQLPSTAVERLLNDKVMSAEIDGFDVDSLSEKKFAIMPSKMSTGVLVFNQRKAPLNNKAFRDALVYCFNRDSYKAELPQSMEVASAIIPPSIKLSNKSYRDFAGMSITPAFNSDTAFEFYKKSLVEMDKASITALKMIAIKNDEFSFSSCFSHPSQILQKELGIFIGVEELSKSDYNKRLSEGSYDIALVELSSNDSKPETVLLPFYTDIEKNQFGYDSSDFNSLYNSILTEPNENTVNNSIKQAEQLLIDNSVVIPLYYKSDYIATKKDISSIEKNPYNGLISFKNTRLL